MSLGPKTAILVGISRPLNTTSALSFGLLIVGPPAWKQHPTWYQVSENDHMIPPDAERMFAKQMNATTISLPSSHASLVSHPNEVAQLILNAAQKDHSYNPTYDDVKSSIDIIPELFKRSKFLELY